MRPHPKKNTTTYRPFLERLGGSPVKEFVGEFGELFYDPAEPTLDSLRISDGKTPGGVRLGGNIKKRVAELYEMVDGTRLEKIQNIISSFLEVGIDEFTDVKDRIENLEGTTVKRAGDTMTGGLKVRNNNGYKYEIIPQEPSRPAGTTRFTYNDQTVAEMYWDPNDNHIDFSFPTLNRISEDDVMLEIGRDAVSIFTKTDIKGDLFVNDIDVLEEIGKVKLELAAELLGLSIALKTKYNKEGGSIFGPVEVKPNGTTGITTFKVDGDGVQCPLPPTSDSHLTNKRYVDTTTIPFNMRKLAQLPN